jgi:hypothetical protein
MAHADTVSPEFLQRVAGQLRDAVEKHLPLTPVEEKADFLLPAGVAANPLEKATIQLHLCETFAVWKLKARTIDALNAPDFSADISDCVEPTKFLYHQVREKGELIAFARSRVGDEEYPTSLSQYNISPLVSSVDRAIGIIERSENDDEVAASDPVVRLLEIPSHHIIALWLYAETETVKASRAIIVMAPKSISVRTGDRLLASEEFFELLKQSGTIQAITERAG